MLSGKRLHVLRARQFDKPFYGLPGQVGMINHEGASIICGDNRAVILEEVMLDGTEASPRETLTSLRIRLPARGEARLQLREEPNIYRPRS